MPSWPPKFYNPLKLLPFHLGPPQNRWFLLFCDVSAGRSDSNILRNFECRKMSNMNPAGWLKKKTIYTRTSPGPCCCHSPNNTKTQCLFTACLMCLSSRSVCYHHGHFWTVEEHTVSVHPFWLKWRKYFWHTIESTTRKPTTPRQQCGATPNSPRAHTHDIPSWMVFFLGFSLVRRWFDARKQRKRPEHAGKGAQFSREKAAVSNCRGGSGEQRKGVATPADFTDFTDITIYRLYSDIPTCCARRGLRHVFIETIIEISMGQLFRSAKCLGGWFNGTVNIMAQWNRGHI